MLFYISINFMKGASKICLRSDCSISLLIIVTMLNNISEHEHLHAICNKRHNFLVVSFANLNILFVALIFWDFIYFCFFTCKGICLNEFLCTVHIQCSESPEKDIESSGSRVTDSCEERCGGWKHPLEEQYSPLMSHLFSPQTAPHTHIQTPYRTLLAVS